MPKPKPKAAPEAVARCERFVASLPDVTRKGAANPYTSLNGNMFSFLTPEGGIALRFAAADREAYLRAHPGSEVVVYDTLMKDYVMVSPALQRKTAKVLELFRASYDHARTLKPKPTTRKATSKSKKKASKKASRSKKAATKVANKGPAATKKKAVKKRTATAVKKAAKKRAATTTKKKAVKKRTATAAKQAAKKRAATTTKRKTAPRRVSKKTTSPKKRGPKK